MTRALLIHGGAIGDFVMSLRIVAALRVGGAEHVTVLGRQHVAEIAGLAEGVDAFIDIESAGFHALFAPDTRAPAWLAAELGHFNIAVNMLGGAALNAKLSACGIGRVVDVDPRPRADWRGHITDQWLADLRAAGIEGVAGLPRILVSGERKQATRLKLTSETGIADASLAARGKRGLAPSRARLPRSKRACREVPVPFCHGPLVVLHPGSGGRAKCWPRRHFISLAQSCQTRGWDVVFLLGPAEVERLTATEVEELRRTAPVLVGWPLREVAALLATSGAFVGNDSGIAHLAAAVGTPTICIFGPSDPVLWRPLGEHVHLVNPASPALWPTVEEVASALHQRRFP